MRIFLSFSGDRSAAVAAAIRDWLPNVLQSARPWMSQSDIQKGTRWPTEIATILSECAVGIICLTPENRNEPWVAFEAGALSKSLQSSRVCPYLFDMNLADLPYPLAMFQGARANMSDTRKLLASVNAALGPEGLDDQRLDRSFEQWWPSLAADLAKIPSAFVENKAVRPDRELLEEIVMLMRSQLNEKRDMEMLARIHGFRAVLKEIAITVQTNRGRTPEVDLRLQALRAELDEAKRAFDGLATLVDPPPSVSVTYPLEILGYLNESAPVDTKE